MTAVLAHGAVRETNKSRAHILPPRGGRNRCSHPVRSAVERLKCGAAGKNIGAAVKLFIKNTFLIAFQEGFWWMCCSTNITHCSQDKVSHMCACYFTPVSYSEAGWGGVYLTYLHYFGHLYHLTEPYVVPVTLLQLVRLDASDSCETVFMTILKAAVFVCLHHLSVDFHFWRFLLLEKSVCSVWEETLQQDDFSFCSQTTTVLCC